MTRIVVKRVTLARPPRRPTTQSHAHRSGEPAPLGVGRSPAEAVGHLVRELVGLGLLGRVEVLDAAAAEGGAT
jgi:hypothetical protein